MPRRYRLSIKMDTLPGGALQLTAKGENFQSWAVVPCGCWECTTEAERHLICCFAAGLYHSGVSGDCEIAWRSFSGERHAVDLAFLSQVEGLDDWPVDQVGPDGVGDEECQPERRLQ